MSETDVYPTESGLSVAEPGVAETRSFLDAIFAIELALDTNRPAAITAFPAALALASADDWKLLDYLVEVFTLHPREAALRRLNARWATADELERERMLRLVPDTNPALHNHETTALLAIVEARARRNNTTIDDEFALLHVQLQTAEMPRQSIRTWRTTSLRYRAYPKHPGTDHNRRPEHARARISARGSKRRPAHVEPATVTDYVRELLFVDTEADATARLRQRLSELAARGAVFTGATAPRGWIPRHPGEVAPRPVELATAIWDHEYCLYVADQRDQARALDGERTTSREDSIVWAATRTGLRGRSDRREAYLFQGNGLDDFATAMTSTLGWRCVSCFVERATTDRHPIHTLEGVLRSDDGLCDYCRADRRPGLPALPSGFTATDLATAYCGFFTEHYPSAARALLAEVRGRAPQWLTATIDDFLAEHPELPGAPEPVTDTPEAAPARAKRGRERDLPPGLRHGRCEGCTTFVPVHDDGFCTTCRVWLGLHVPTPRERHVTA